MKQFIRVYGENGVYLFTEEELEQGLDRENEGVKGEIIEEKNFGIDTKLERKINDQV